jgi:hypothetical protein
VSKLYGGDWRILVCEGCNEPLGDNTMGAIHMGCPKHPSPGDRKTAPGYARVRVVPFDAVLEFLRNGTRYDPATGRDRRMNGWTAAADELEREFGAHKRSKA